MSSFLACSENPCSNTTVLPFEFSEINENHIVNRL